MINMNTEQIVDRFGQPLNVGDWVVFASKCGASALLMKGRVYAIKNGLARIETFRKTYDNERGSIIDVEAEMKLNPQKISTSTDNCMVVKN